MYSFSDKLKDLNGAATREILKLTSRPDMISFAGGMPAAECLPREIIAGISAEVLSRPDASRLLQYGQTEGLPELNAELINYLASIGIKASTETVQVVSGGQQGLDLMCKAFINKGDVILVENPTYLAFLQIAKTYEAKVIGVNSGDDGLDLGDLEQKLKAHRPKLLYAVPTFSNPTGRTYPLENRKGIIELCKKYGTIIIEDDPYGRLRYTGEAVPLMKTLDDDGTVVYITSFSKTVAPSLRIALCCGPAEIIRKVSIGKQGADVQNPALCQMIMAEYLKRGHFLPVLQSNIEVYRARRDAFLKALDENMPKEVKYTRPDGGLFIWMELPEYIDAAALLPEALKKSVAYINGNEFYADGSGKNTLRLNFSNSDISRIQNGVKILSELFSTKIKEYKHG
ncbi:MAG: PLP-dependent aminotransferase family protein [Clostridiales bacterium]|nr:PLP-dependent aminotransferase family protein [Clostridiales bacterium]